MRSVLKFSLIFLLAVAFTDVPAAAKKKIEVFGYSDFSFSIDKVHGQKRREFSQNRTNLLLISELARKWDFFINVEFNGHLKLNSQKSMMGGTEIEASGGMELEEAWVGYALSEKFKIKVGLFHVPFGYFNVIQDVSPSYITVRPPMIYDDVFREGMPVSIIPDKANLEVTGKLHGRDLIFQYHVYMGNSSGNSLLQADDAPGFSFGTRLLLKYKDTLRFGFSTYFDTIAYSQRFLTTFTTLLMPMLEDR
ncbi:MAG: hypothetical protein GY765_18620, partial [bacterium]|nr:hypothetical protein [bacterium]